MSLFLCTASWCPLSCLLPWPPSLTGVGQLSPSISWKCDGWQVEGERTGLLRARQTHSHYPLVFHLAQPRWSHTHTLEFPGQWWISNLPAAGWAHCLLSQRERKREATMLHLSQSLATQTHHLASLLFPHCQIVPNATGGAVIFSLPVYARYVLRRTALLSAG